MGRVGRKAHHAFSGGPCDPPYISDKGNPSCSIATDKDTIFGEPAWDVARLFPAQGTWSEAEYFALSDRFNRRIEFSDGCIEVLPASTMTVQEALCLLFDQLNAFVAPNKLGKVLFAALPIRLRPGKYREPHLFFLFAKHAHRMHEQYWDGADLVMEVVSEDRDRDLVKKRADYAEAGIPEYWIVDPALATISVLVLEGDCYQLRGEFAPGTQADSALLPGFAVDVTTVFAPKV